MFCSPAQNAAMAKHPQFRGSPWTAIRMRVTGELRAALILGLAAFTAALVGLATAHAFSVSFWPANAILVGMAMRDRRMICVGGVLGALAGFLAADSLFGRTLSLSAWFAGTNLIGTMTATASLLQLEERDLCLRRVHSMLRILVSLLPACLTAGLCGALLVMNQFHGSALQASMTWPASELVNYLVVLPAMLTMFRGSTGSLARGTARFDRMQLGPVLFLAASCAAAAAVDGPGSIMFPLPALLLCALTYSVPTTALLTMVLGTGALTGIGLGIVDIGQDMAVPRMVVSIRIAVAFLVLVPLTIASVVAVRDELLDQLREAADHDGLTGLLNRRAFEQSMRTQLRAPRLPGRSLVILWLDIDHFKAINDRHGHLAGDAVLQAFAATAQACCREGDLVGRMGGEEFALLVEVAGASGAATVAERLRKAFAEQTVRWNHEPIRATVSIGACHLMRPERASPDLVKRLDEALYRAKHKGRDRIEWLAEGEALHPALHAAH
jgi:diguanylate cyclase (GGDEF)-like protein